MNPRYQTWVAIFDLLWPPIVKVLSFGLGAWGFYYETVVEQFAQTAVLGVAVMFMGIPVFVGRDMRQKKLEQSHDDSGNGAT